MSDDLQTLDLYSILDDREQLTHLHALQLLRVDELAITGGARPTGMRLSTPDPVRRVKAAIDPFWALPFDRGVGARGHALEVFLEVALFHAYGSRYSAWAYDTQTPIQWHEHGRSAFDFVLVDSGRVISCKSSVGGGTPTAENVAQERRMLALAGYPAGSEFEIWVVCPSTFRAVGPYTYTLDAEHIDATGRELDGVTAAYTVFSRCEDPTAHPGWNDPAYWALTFGLESSSGAFRYERLDASGAIEARNRRYLAARERAAEAKREADDAKQLIRTHVEEQLAAATKAGALAKSVTAYSGDMEATYTIDKRGALRVTTRTIDAA
jgi:hypothetical protein